MYDRWLKSQLRREDFLLSSYGYANESFEWLKKHGGLTFLDAGNSHPKQFWDIMTEEHRVWGFDAPPVARHHFFRSMRMMESVDYIFSPSNYVTDSFLQRGFPAERILHLPYAVNFEHFSPPPFSRPSSRPLSVICTGAVSFRKGAPYLLEAMRLVRKKVRNSRLLLTRGISPGMESILSKYGDLEIDWSPHLPHEGLSKRLWEGDIFALPSLEEGMGRTVQEAMACGLPVILTPNCGAVDFVKEGLNGSVIPIRNPEALASAILYWWDRIQDHCVDTDTAFKDRLSFESFSSTFEHQMNPLISGI
jgi:alpha-maltose-1-phosphate synthase